MTRRRDVLTGIAAIVAGAGITGAAAAVAQRPDKALHDAIAQYLKATEDRRASEAAWNAAQKRATARYPAKLPDWLPWARANHPEGEFDPLGDRATLTHQAMEAMEAHLAGIKEGASIGRLADDEELIRLQRAVFTAGDADKIAYYAETRAPYDQLVAERRAAIVAIDAEEGLPALDATDTVAYERRCAAHDALLACRPTTWAAFAIKTQTLLQTPWYSDGEIEPEEKDALLADIAALIAGGAA